MRRVNGRVGKAFHLGTSADAKFKAKAAERGWDAMRQGWPDFLVVADGKTMFVEVKSASDKLSEKQVKLFTALESMGIKVKVWWEVQPDKLLGWRKFFALRMNSVRNEADAKAVSVHNRNPPRYSARVMRQLRRSIWIDKELGRRF